VVFVIPLSIFAFQTIALLIGIAIEAKLFHQKLHWTRQQSVQYATTANLVSTIVLWLLLFLFDRQLPSWLRFKIIRLVLFSSSVDNIGFFQIDAVFILALILTYVLLCLIKIKTLDILEVLSQPLSTLTEREDFEDKSTLALRLSLAFSQGNKQKNKTVFLANAITLLAISGLLLLHLLLS
jgi:hypothetical protein